MLKISDFSRIAQVPIATLRYYDQLGLLKPAQVDRFTEYRYYDVAQLPRLNRILALKDLGFSLEQIDGLLKNNVSLDEMRGMLAVRLADAERDAQEAHARLARVQARLRGLEQEGKPPRYDIVLKPLAAQWVVSTRQIVARMEDMEWICDDLHLRLRGWMARHRIAGLPSPAPQLMNVYHNTEYSETNLDVEALALIAKPITLGTKELSDAPFEIKTRQLESAEIAACGVHRGSMITLPDLIQTALLWSCANGYTPSGGVRELHLAGGPGQNLAEEVVEVQIPVMKSEGA